MAYISSLTDLDGSNYDIRSKLTNGILFGQVDGTSTSTAFTASVPGVTEYYDGLAIMLRNNVVTSAANFTININGLGGKPSYSNMATGATPTRDTTIFNVNYTMLIVYSSTLVSGGAWIMYRGYDANTNTIGYQLRTNSSTLPMKQITYRYRLLFTSDDGTGWVPANTSTSTNATASRTVNQAKIDPFGPIVYYGTTASVAAGSNPSAAYLWQEYTLSLGYSFNRTGAALVLPYPKSIYIKCAPQTDGSAIIDADTPYVTALPSSEDGKIYIYLGRTYSATNVEMTMDHPVYYYKDGAIRLWTNPAVTSSDVTVTPIQESGTEIAQINGTSIYSPTETDPTVPAWAKASTKPSYTAAEVGALPDSTTIPSKTSDLTNDSGYITGISSSDVTTALGYTPYNSTNPDGYVKGSDTTNDATGTIGYYSAGGISTAQPTITYDGLTHAVISVGEIYTDIIQEKTITGTSTKSSAKISVMNQGSGAAPKIKIKSDNVTNSNEIVVTPTSTTITNITTPTADSDAANKKYVDDSIPTVPTNVSDLTNDSGYITGISSSDVTTALGYTPYNSTNPNSYVNATQAAAAAPVQSVNGQTGTVTITVPTNVSAFTNDAGYLTLATLPIYDGGVS